MTKLTGREIITFERVEVRRAALLLLLVLALLSPNIESPGSIPAVRLEQLALAAMLPSLGWFCWRRREFLRIGAVDIIFGLLAGAITVSIIFAPMIVDSVERSFRDPFEVARVAEYWLMYRLALTVARDERTVRGVVYTLACVMGLMGLFALLQYIGPGSFNANVSRAWSVGHNLVGLEREGRVTSTVGNANYFAIFMMLPLVLGLSFVLLRQQVDRRLFWLAVAASFIGTLSMVMAQSRTAALGLLFAMFVALFVAVASRPRRTAPFQAIGAFLLFLVLSIAWVNVNPPDVGSFNERFNPFAVQDDTSAIIRFQKLKSFFKGFTSEEPAFCRSGERIEKRPIAKSHLPASTTGAPPAAPTAIARDDRRKKDVGEITDGIIENFCDRDSWPVGKPLEQLLVPKYMDALPRDPEGKPYQTYLSTAGFTVGAALENPADAQGPVYALSTIPNVIVNGSAESGKGLPSRWFEGTGGPSSGDVLESPTALFGTHVAHVQLGPNGDLRQFIVLDFSLDTDYAAAFWARSANGREQKARLYLVGQQADGSEYDGLWKTTVTLPADGRWVPLQYTFRAPDKGRIIVLQLMVRAADNLTPLDAHVDGAMVTQGTIVPSFQYVTDIDPTTLRGTDLPQFADSPLVGVGPRNDAEAGSFDNEYQLMLDRYGILGFLPYVAMYIAALLISLRAWRRSSGLTSVLALSLFTFTLGLFVFNVGAGSYYHFQIMAVLWLLLGYLQVAPAPRARRPDAAGAAEVPVATAVR